MCRIENEDIRAFQKRSTTSCDYSKHWLKDKAACPRSPQAKFGMIRVLGLKSQSATTAREIDPRKRFVADSPLEGNGFELPVPREIGLRSGSASCAPPAIRLFSRPHCWI